MISDQVRDLICDRLEAEIEATQYFNTESDPAWFFQALDRLHTELITGVYSEVHNPCAEMAGQVWLLGCRGRYQESSRKHVISILFSLNNELKKAQNNVCGAV